VTVLACQNGFPEDSCQGWPKGHPYGLALTKKWQLLPSRRVQPH